MDQTGDDILLDRQVCLPYDFLFLINFFFFFQAEDGIRDFHVTGVQTCALPISKPRMQDAPFRLPVQWVNRSSSEFRGFAGMVAGGRVTAGDRVVVLPAGRETTVARVVGFEQDLDAGVAGQAVTLTLSDEIDISRGDVIAAAEAPAEVGEQFEATVVWMAEEPLLRGRTYLMRAGTKTVPATVAPIRYKLDVDTGDQIAANQLDLNEIGVVQLELGQPIAFDPYVENRDTGGFILIDRITNHTVGAGLLRFALRRGENVAWQAVEVDRVARSSLKAQRPFVVWLTGLPGAGKSSIANLVEQRLYALGRHTVLLDGAKLRPTAWPHCSASAGSCPDLGAPELIVSLVPAP